MKRAVFEGKISSWHDASHLKTVLIFFPSILILLIMEGNRIKIGISYSVKVGLPWMKNRYGLFWG